MKALRNFVSMAIPVGVIASLLLAASLSAPAKDGNSKADLGERAKKTVKDTIEKDKLVNDKLVKDSIKKDVFNKKDKLIKDTAEKDKFAKDKLVKDQKRVKKK